MLIDTHVNLHHPAFAEDCEAVIARARAAGVGLMITICDRVDRFGAIAALAHAHEGIFTSLGAHPHEAKDHRDLSADRLIEMARAHSNVVGIGETGLDKHYNLSPLEDQISSLRAHIGAARALDLPLIIHTREADDVMGDILEEEMGKGAFRVLMHCYTSGMGLAKRVLALGGYFSFSGIMTFKNAHDVRIIAKEIPLDRVMLETDCPYLTPVPHRGQRCEPMHVADVYRCFCAERGLSAEEGAEIIEANVRRLFSALPPR